MFTDNEDNTIVLKNEFKKTFGLGYDVFEDTWYVIENENLDKTATSVNVDFAKSSGIGQVDNTWLILFEYSPIDTNSFKYDITIRGADYVIESREDLKFYNIKSVKLTDYI